MKYRFECIETEFQQEIPNRKVIVESNSIVLSDILQDFEDFLRGCGFIIQGSIEYVPAEEEKK